MPGGFATIAGRKCMVIGHQKGRELKENIKRNFGCANPEGYRKALRHIDDNIPEPMGGAHQNHAAAIANRTTAVSRHLDELTKLPTDELLAQRSENSAASGNSRATRNLQSVIPGSIPPGCSSRHRKASEEIRRDD